MKKKILLIDDKDTIAMLVSIYLNPDYEIVYFKDPAKAIEWLNSGNSADLIISDIHMPFMRGDEFLHYMKHHDSYKDIPFVLLSSEENTTERIRLLKKGALDYIIKPFNPMELKIRIKNILG